MKAIVVEGKNLVWTDHEEPRVEASHVVLEVKAVGVNRADLLQARGLYAPPAGVTSILGLECAGRAEGSPLVPDGDYMALLPGGAYAERVAVPKDMLLPVPPGLSMVEAAALPEAMYTSYLNLFELGGLAKNESLWITAGSSGVGSMAIQMARAAGAIVYVSAGGAEKLKRCLDLGATGGSDYRSENAVEKILELTAGAGVDMILDLVGGSEFDARMRAIKSRGRVLLIGLMAGSKTTVDLNRILTGNIMVRGSTLRFRTMEEKTELTRRIKETAMAWISRGLVKPVVDSVFDIRDATTAHRRMKKGEHFGKIILRVS